MNTINGTSIALIKKWITAMENSIQKNTFFYVKDGNDLGVNSLNKARLSVMYRIFHITDMDYSESQWNGFQIYNSKQSIQKNKELMMKYFKTMKSLINN